ncbi:tetratricopeptide repeat protein [Lipingzhangella sp. LS1_29]|uniref:Tetratricopeptide repeat protein n=1 Tax=Lipingzhangella rawalii TaxID=2055835 RepID=A0ABU2H1N4_9ACTN|nr:tetratricopeptide repeat protein [Lipingzhangella rawalii]MDS1269215.1 tetratricopeptide repeat protein [Lipingzhangella rawalii]
MTSNSHTGPVHSSSADVDATAGEDTPPVELCAQARDLAEHGYLKRSAQVYSRALECAQGADRARAALGLAVVRHDLGQFEDAREAARIAIDTGHPEFAPRAAAHLAMSYEQRGQDAAARDVWQQVLSLDTGGRYSPTAHYGLARIAEDAGQPDQAEAHWHQALTADDPELAAQAARECAQRRLARGELEAAEQVLREARTGSPDPPLRLLSAATHVERAIAEAEAALTECEPDPESGRSPHPDTAAAAVELLARLLALRGDTDAAVEVWQHGLDHADSAVAQAVRQRLRRGFLEPDTDPDSQDPTQTSPQEPPPGRGDPERPAPWWDDYIAAAVASESTPMLLGELFVALTRMYAPVATAHAAQETSPDALRAALAEVLRIPGDYLWGRALHDDFRERMRRAASSTTHVLPEGWPDGTL